jgi:hypothetical protein
MANELHVGTDNIHPLIPLSRSTHKFIRTGYIHIDTDDTDAKYLASFSDDDILGLVVTLRRVSPAV